MDSSKAWYASKTIWGSLVALLVPLIGTVTHYQLTDVDAQTITDTLSAIGGGIGALVAIYGRVVASGPIGGAK